MRTIMGCLLLCAALPLPAGAQTITAPLPKRNYPDQLVPLFSAENRPPQILTQDPGGRMTENSWVLAPAPAPEEIKVHDVVLVLVDERAVQQQNRQFQRQKQGTYALQLADWFRIDSQGNLANAAANEPAAEVNYQNRLQARGNQNVLESLTYRIAATVTSIRPNGNVIIGARKSIITNRDAWVYHLTGELNPKHIDAKDTIKSEYVVNLQIVKRSSGKVYDSTKRGWMLRLLDTASPF